MPETRLPLGALGAVGVAQGAATVATAFALAALVAAVVSGDPVTAPVIALASLMGARALLAGGAELLAAWAGQRVTRALRARTLRRWLDAPAEGRPDPSRGVTLATQGVTSVEPYVARFLPAIVHAAVVPGLAVVTLLLVDWPSGVIVIATLPLLPLFAALIGRTTQEATQRRWRALTDLSGHFLDVVRGLPTLVTYGRAARQVDTIGQVSEQHRASTMGTLRLAFLSSAALELLATISVALVAVTCGLRLTTGSMGLETALVAILLAPEAYWPIRRVGAEFHNAADGAEALADLLAGDEPATPASTTGTEASDQRSALGSTLEHDLRTEAASDAAGTDTDADTDGAGRLLTGVHTVVAPPDEVPDRVPDEIVVVVEDLDYAYPGSITPVLRRLRLTIPAGLTVITGASGVGKSTLLEIVAGVRTPSAGSVTAPSAHLVTQRPFLPTGTLSAALTLGNEASNVDQWYVLRQVGLDGVVAGEPHGLSTVIGDDGFGLSAGQRARLALARALLAQERLVLLDEPTAHLDPEGAHAVHEIIRALARERTVVVVTHRPELVQLADQHVHLSASRQGVPA